MEISIMRAQRCAIICSESERKLLWKSEAFEEIASELRRRSTPLRVAAPNLPEVLALWLRPAQASWLLVLAHGAGAGMNHPFLENLAMELAAAGVATLRYQFPYVEQRRHAPDPRTGSFLLSNALAPVRRYRLRSALLRVGGAGIKQLPGRRHWATLSGGKGTRPSLQ
jgi:hypothetical protein